MHGADGWRWLGSPGLCLLLAMSLYVVTAVAIGHGALARLLVGGDAERTAHDVIRSRARLVDALEVERRRIERDLYDGAQQRLVRLTMVLGLAALGLDGGPPAARALVDRAAGEANAAQADLHRLVRGIHPQVLTDHGLAEATAELAGRSPDWPTESPPRTAH
ncbi:histidine kinase [Paractinoplanes globisporus]|uniref:histidine kinase n=1 Tax=Paractinoplanes globisporus TaxID=113565 RepID=A0ABW6W5V7_9ACTN|nr:histidine kinase [Actinoplanes globisporus]